MPIYSTALTDALDSWKQIAAYLDRDVRTVMRWERSRGLPVHRLPGGSSVYTWKSELDAWRKSGAARSPDRAENLRQPAATSASVAVLPFANLSAEKESEYFGDGLADEILNALTRLEELRVTARTSSFVFRDRQADVRDIGRRLSVQFLLEGSVQRIDRKIRVSAQLVNAEDGFHVWSSHYDRDLSDMFALQDEIAAAIASALKVRIGSMPSSKRRTSNLEAYAAWLKGRHRRFGARTLQDIMEAGQCFSRAVELDRDFAPAHLALGQYYLHLAILGLVPPERMATQGSSEVVKALELDDGLGEAYATLGQLRALFDFDWTGAEDAFAKALALEPGSAPILRWHAGSVLAPLNRLEQAEAEASDALELDPLCPESHFAQALILFFRRQYDRAEAGIRTSLELGGGNPFTRWLGGVIAALQGRFDEALANCDLAVREYGPSPMLAGCLGMIYGFTGRTKEAQEVLAQLDARSAEAYVSPIHRAWVHMGLGHADEAFQWLDRAIDSHEPHILHLPVKPVYDRLREDSRFDALLRKMHLPVERI